MDTHVIILFRAESLIEATDGSLRQLEEERKQQSQHVEKERKHAESLAAQLEKISVTIKMKVGEEDRLFGSVTSQMIAEALVEKEITLDKRHIELEEPLKALGIYDVPVKLAGGVMRQDQGMDCERITSRFLVYFIAILKRQPVQAAFFLFCLGILLGQ